MNYGRLLSASLLAMVAVACSEPPPGGAAAQPAPPVAPAPPAPALKPVAPPPVVASASPVAKAIDASGYSADLADKAAQQRMMIRVQVLLDRARFSPGVIDGAGGENLRLALAAYEAAHGLPADGALESQVWLSLTSGDPGPVMQDYVITQADVAGPFQATIPTALEAQAKLDHLGYTSPAEALAEKFHMDEKLLRALNPQADFGAAGSTILVAAPRAGKLEPVVRIEVDKAGRQVRAFGEGDRLLAVYPATVGSADRPAPSGVWEVRTVAPNPTYTYDPGRLTFGDAKAGKMTVAAGPNNPVGSMWIDLTKDTYGIHGTPDPSRVGKTESHGCVRLTNWDVTELGGSVKKGAKVVFTGEAGAPKT